MFFSLNSWLLALVLLGILFGAVALGLLAGRALSHHAETLREPFGVVQAALLTLVGLVLAFTLAMAVTRYEARRAAVVDDSNAIGTAYLRAQTLHEPMRSASLRLYPEYADASIALSNSVPGSGDAKRAIARESQIQRQLWSLAGQSLAGMPVDSAPRLYLESLNVMIDMQTTRVAALNNRVPPAISLVELARRRCRAGFDGHVPRDVLARRRHGGARCGPAHAAALRHLRPRPALSRVHHRAGCAARRRARRHGVAACRRRAPVGDL